MSIYMKATFTNLNFKEFNKDNYFKKLIKIFEENQYEKYFFTELENDEANEKKFDRNIQFFLKEFRRRYLKKSKIFGYVWKKKYEGYHFSFLLLNVKIYYLLLKSKIFGDLKEFIMNNIVKTSNFYVPLRIYYLKKEHISNYFLALKWFYNEDTKKYYSEELLKEMKEYEEYIEKYRDPEFVKEMSRLDWKLKS